MKIGDKVRIIQDVGDKDKEGIVLSQHENKKYFRIEGCEHVYCDSQVVILEKANVNRELFIEIW